MWTDLQIVLPYAIPPLTANQRLHYMERASRVRHLRATTALLMRDINRRRPPLETGHKLHVRLEYVPADRRRRDADNLVPTLKAICDGLVDAGLVPDDTPEFMEKHMPTIGKPQRGLKHRLVLRLTDEKA